MPGPASAVDRLRYEPNHWARDEDPGRALASYLELCQRPFNRTKLEVMSGMLPAELAGQSVLDYGCGAGSFTVLCARRGARVVAVDAEAAVLRTASYYARREGVAERCRFLDRDTFARRLPGETFDVIVAKDVIEHVPDDQGLLRDFARCQRAGGRLLVSTQSALSLTFVVESLYFRVWRGEAGWCGWDPTHLRFYTPRSLARKLRAAGYHPRRRHGFAIVPYRILTYALLFRRWIELPALRYVDLWLGGRFPLNLFGWDVAVLAERA
ncbi:MAG TPA: class I SAM-dependent methyltransferase [Methylomirabilota bacterium]|nr:class I SAM-dependent methyltransferase [Methylomirabilota bacterium]